MLEDYNTNVLSLMVQGGASQAEVEAAYTQLSNEAAEKRKSFQLSAAQQTLGGMSNFLQNLYVATGSKNKEMFKVMKAVSIANAIVNTAEAATTALKAPPGPPWSFAYVAAAVAAGAAQIATIAGTEPGGSQGISASGTANPSYSGGSPSAYPIPQRLEEPQALPTQTFNIVIQNGVGDAAYWQKIYEDNIIPAINNATDRNVVVNVRTS